MANTAAFDTRVTAHVALAKPTTATEEDWQTARLYLAELEHLVSKVAYTRELDRNGIAQNQERARRLLGYE